MLRCGIELLVVNKEEQQIIYQLYFLEKSEREVCAAMNLVLSTFQQRKRVLFEKLRKNLEENF